MENGKENTQSLRPVCLSVLFCLAVGWLFCCMLQSRPLPCLHCLPACLSRHLHRRTGSSTSKDAVTHPPRLVLWVLACLPACLPCPALLCHATPCYQICAVCLSVSVSLLPPSQPDNQFPTAHSPVPHERDPNQTKPKKRKKIASKTHTSPPLPLSSTFHPCRPQPHPHQRQHPPCSCWSRSARCRSASS